MGTDIHLYVEKLNNGKWERVLEPYVSGYSGTRDWSPWYADEPDKQAPDPRQRHYDLFAFLANVRNGHGFAGVFTHLPVTPQFAGRGIPNDTSYREPDGDDDENELNDFPYLGDHSYTWATLQELLSAPWDMVFHSGGVVGPEQFRVWEKEGYPTCYSGGVGGAGIIVHADPVEYKKLLETGTIRVRPDGSYLDYCRVTWNWQPLADEELGFRRWLRECLLPMADGHPESIRILMGFDS